MEMLEPDIARHLRDVAFARPFERRAPIVCGRHGLSTARAPPHRARESGILIIGRSPDWRSLPRRARL